MRRSPCLTPPAGNDPPTLSAEEINRRLGALDPRQVAIWWAMAPVRRMELAFEAHQFALDVVCITERQRHPDLSPKDFDWRVTRRMQGDPNLGRDRRGSR